MLTFDAIKIGIASPEQILAWSYGEVKKPETINYRTLKPETGRICSVSAFSAPPRTGSAIAESTRRSAIKGKICDRCGVEVTRAKVRRERMGHIRAGRSRFPTSGISRVSLPAWVCCWISAHGSWKRCLYFAAYIVTDPGDDAAEQEPDSQRKGIPRYAVRNMKTISRPVWAPKR